MNEARDDGVWGWQWHQLNHMQTICTSLQSDNYTNTPSPIFTGRMLFKTPKSTVSKHTHTHIHLTAFCPGLLRWASTRKVTPIWISLKQETVSGSGISWAICKSAPLFRQITTPAPHHSVFYRPDSLPAAQLRARKQGARVKALKAKQKYTEQK